ncbi:MAG: hypothetical protein NTW76_13780 [Corynebacteriales bacterium]|nr:hypothetical protein [Mycobacteriales bacterium]
MALAVRILTGSADLSGASCIGRAELFDPDLLAESLGYPDEAARWAAIQATCVGCPARGRCWAWVTELTDYRKPLGPTAASVLTPFSDRRRPRRVRFGHVDAS